MSASHRTHRVLAAAVLLAGPAGAGARAAAQTPHRPAFSATLALGGGSMGFSGLVAGAMRANHVMVTLRTTGNLPPAGRAVATDLALLLSYVEQHGRGSCAVGAGIALVETGDSSRTYAAPFNAHTGPGFPLQASALWRPAPGLGLGLIATADLNPRHSFGALLLGLQLGRFD